MKLFIFCLSILLSYQSFSEDYFPFFGGEHGTIVGEEYWVFDDSKEGSPYSRNEIIWNFSSAPSAAQKCAKEGHAQLIKWLGDKNSVVTKYLKVIDYAGGVTNFYLWTNDYSTLQAENKGKRPREASVWNWENMFLKYESTVHVDGRCSIPNEEDVINSLRNIAEKQEEKRRGDLNFIQRIFDGERSRSFDQQLTDIQNSGDHNQSSTAQ